MKETKVYVVKAPQGEYEDYQEPIVKVFLDKNEAKAYVKKENAKMPLEQAKKCQNCVFMWKTHAQEGKVRPSCFNGDKFDNCKDYFRFVDIQPLFIEEHKIADIKIHDRIEVEQYKTQNKWQKLKEWISLTQPKNSNHEFINGVYIAYRDIIDKMQELEGEDE